MARPEKQEHEKLSEVVKLRLTLAEHEHVRSQAAAADLSVSEFLRRRALGFVVQPPPARADAALLSELNRIGVNVNQLAKAYNSGQEFRGTWRMLADELSGILAKVAKRYGR